MLSSRDTSVRARGIVLLSSMLSTCGSEILESFDEYAPFFSDVLRRHRDSEVTMFTLTQGLCRAVYGNPPIKSQEAANALLWYFAKCVEAMPRRSNGFISGELKSADVVACALELTKYEINGDDIAPYVVIMAVTENQGVYQLLNGLIEHVAGCLERNAESNILVVAKCALSADKNVSELGAKVLKSMLDRIPAIAPCLFQVAPQLRVRAESGRESFAPIYEILKTRMKAVEWTGPDNEPSRPFMNAVFPEMCFERTGEATIEYAGKGSRKKGRDGDGTDRKSLSRVLDTISVFVQESQRNEEPEVEPPKEDKGEAAPEEGDEEEQLMNCPAKKREGHNSWKQRRFSFFAKSKCIVWTGEGSSKLKGALFVRTDTKVEKGEQLVLKITTTSKVHQIKFRSEELLQRWFKDLTTARES